MAVGLSFPTVSRFYLPCHHLFTRPWIITSVIAGVLQVHSCVFYNFTVGRPFPALSAALIFSARHNS